MATCLKVRLDMANLVRQARAVGRTPNNGGRPVDQLGFLGVLRISQTLKLESLSAVRC